MEKVECFKTSDGRIFENEVQANAHEFGVRYFGDLKEFFDSGNCSYSRSSPQGTMVQRAIIEWEMFKTKKGEK
jgi:hypothetical protein